MSPKLIGTILAVILTVSGLYLAEQYWLKPSTQVTGDGPGTAGCALSAPAAGPRR